MRWSMALLICLMTFTTLPVWAADKLVLLTEENPPYNYTHPESGEAVGSAVTIVKELMKRAGTDYSLKVLPWRRAFRQARQQPNTCIFVTNRIPERETQFQWVGPLIEGGWAVFRRPGSTLEIVTLKDLRSYVVTGVGGSAPVASLEKTVGINVLAAGSDELAAQMLYRGRADFWMSGFIDAPLAAKASGLPAPELVFLWRKADLSLACSKRTPSELVARLNAINATMAALRLQVIVDLIDSAKYPE